MAPEREEDVKVGRCGLVVWFFYREKKRWEVVKNVPNMMFLKLFFDQIHLESSCWTKIQFNMFNKLNRFQKYQ